MAFKTRLDAWVRLRERAEDDAKLALARARKEAKTAEEALHRAQSEARVDARARGDAAQWQVVENARVRALASVKRAEEGLAKAREREAAVRKAFEHAHRQAEAVRRVSEAKRQEMSREEGRKERKSFDELAVMQFGRKPPV